MSELQDSQQLTANYPEADSGEREFAAMRRDADEVLRLRGRAIAAYASRRPTGFDGLGDLLDLVLPEDPSAEQRIARALGLSPADLAELRASALDPLTMPHGPMVELARAVGLARAEADELLARDHARFAPEQALVDVRSAHAAHRHGSDAAMAAFRAAWDRAEMDDADEDDAADV